MSTIQSPVSGGQIDRESDGELSLSECYHLLQNRRRRAVIRYLAEHGEQVKIGTLSERLVHKETDEPISSQDRHRVYVALYQSHLPKLDDYGVVEYDKDRGIVRSTPLVSDLYARMKADRTGSGGHRRWPAIAGAVLIACAVLAAVISVSPAISNVWLAGGVGLAAASVGRELVGGERGDR